MPGSLQQNQVLPCKHHSDASNIAIGAKLAQKLRDSNVWRPVAFFLKTLLPAGKKYSAFDRELLAIYQAVRHFRNFLGAGPFFSSDAPPPTGQWGARRPTGGYNTRQNMFAHML